MSDADKVSKSFDLAPFEGPDAPAQSRALVSVELPGDAGAPALRAHASGWYSAEHAGGFGFGIGGNPAESKALSRLFKRMAQGGSMLKIRVDSFQKNQGAIIAEFSLAGSHEALSRLVKLCR